MASPNPYAAMPLDVDGSPVWHTAPLQGITHFSDFASVILLTDSAEAGRVWIEQAGPIRGSRLLWLYPVHRPDRC